MRARLEKEGPGVREKSEGQSADWGKKGAVSGVNVGVGRMVKVR